MPGYPIASILLAAAASYGVAALVAAAVAKAGLFPAVSDGRAGCVDGLRGYMAVSVLIHHFIIWVQVTRLGGTWTEPSVHAFNELGSGAVALFFMVTGFVFYPRILAGARAQRWGEFLVGRVFRIMPLIVVSVFLVTALIVFRTGRWFGPEDLARLGIWISTWDEPPLLGDPEAGRVNAWVLWSLWYEWLFYLAIFPVLAVLRDLTRGRLPSWCIPGALLVGAVGLRLAGCGQPILRYLPTFAIGMLASELSRRRTIADRLASPEAAVLALAALAVGMALAPDPYGAALPLFAAFFVCVAAGNSLLGLLRTDAALVLGECSYGVYLMHGVVLSVLMTDLAPLGAAIPTESLPALLPVAVIVCLGLAVAARRLVELPAIALGKALVRSSRSGRASAPAQQDLGSPAAA